MNSQNLNDPKIKVPIMRDMSTVLKKMNEEGFTANFKVTEGHLECLDSNKMYEPSDLVVVNFYRFEGISDPSDNSILYAIEAGDGTRGTLMDAYGAYSDPDVEKFMKQVKIEEKE
jgi:hypothetical protein